MMHISWTQRSFVQHGERFTFCLFMMKSNAQMTWLKFEFLSASSQRRTVTECKWTELQLMEKTFKNQPFWGRSYRHMDAYGFHISERLNHL